MRERLGDEGIWHIAMQAAGALHCIKSRRRRRRSAISLKWPAEIRQHPHRNEIDADQRLDSGNNSDPAVSPESEFPRLDPIKLRTDVDFPPPDVEGGNHGEIKSPSKDSRHVGR